ncbi:putative baseplate assembly protein [Chitinimonas koreensis]|uniref:putative baseplate assembly protein n=1 Tax=Chitinimonas koreensis TaxID=356302 RepID=UPI000411EA48|nr:putative baseplate assembly protein [Chitinimonas koreensis]QNM98651.1 putative baseplate assembly protein [Chitinimonas koreensis]
MPLIAPILDDRSFEQLRTELVGRIPVFNPEWTDYNRSDPAITLLELFAYLGEGLQFRFNQIPEATRLAYLKLLDVPLYPARPARALLRCETRHPGGVMLYAGDQARAGKVRFTLDGEAQLWPLDCVTVARKPTAAPAEASEPELHASVQAAIDAIGAAYPDAGSARPYRTALLESDGTSPALDFSDAVDGSLWIAVLKAPDIALTPAAGQRIKLNLGFSPAAVTPTLDQLAPCPGAAAQRGPALEWRATSAQVVDGKPRYLPLRVAGDTTAGFGEEGVVRLELPAELASLGLPAAPDGLEGAGDFPPPLDDARAGQVWFWLRAWRADQSRIGPVRLVCLNAVQCSQSVVAPPELLGGGSGQPGQVFALSQRPVLRDAAWPVQLEVEEGGVWTRWSAVDDFDASSARDRHFSVDAEAGTVRFGPRYPQIGERVRVLAYRYGGGTAGNLPAGAIAKFGDLLAGLAPLAPMKRPGEVEARCGNPLEASGGVDAESIEAALARIPGELRRHDRAVTRDDFAELALQTPGVELGRAECLPLFHAPDRASPRAGTVSVVVWPARDPQHPNAPLPDAYQLKRVCQWLDTRRLVTTELFVIPPTYRQLAISLSIKVRDGYGLDAVRDWVALLLRRYLAPLPPYGPDGRGWPLGRRVLDRELGGVAMQVEGVEYVGELRLAGRADDGSWQEAAAVTLTGWEVPEVAAIAIVDEGSTLPAPGQLVPPPAGGPAVPVPVLREEC